MIQTIFGGVLTVLEELEVGQVVISKQVENSENYKKFKDIVNEKKLKVLVIDASNENITDNSNNFKKNNNKYKKQSVIYPKKLQIEDDLYLEFLWPNSESFIKENPLNNNSIVCKLNYKNFSMLFTGDIEEVAETQMLQEYGNNLQIFNSTILKVAHHGSKTSTTQAFIEAVNPRIAIIGVGENNKFGHPNDEIIERLVDLRYKNIPYRSNGRNIINSR